MKSLLLLSVLAAFVYGQGPKECRCGGFVTTQTGEDEVISFPPIDLDDCTQTAQCADLCLAEWNEITNGGDLCTPSGNATIADDMCDRLAGNGVDMMEPRPVYLYYNVCEGPWQWDGVQSNQELECRNETAIIDCMAPTTALP